MVRRFLFHFQNLGEEGLPRPMLLRFICPERELALRTTSWVAMRRGRFRLPQHVLAAHRSKRREASCSVLFERVARYAGFRSRSGGEITIETRSRRAFAGFEGARLLPFDVKAGFDLVG